MKLRMSTVCTLADTRTERSGFAVHNGARCFPLYIGQVLTERIERMKPYLLNLIITDRDHLRSDQMGW